MSRKQKAKKQFDVSIFKDYVEARVVSNYWRLPEYIRTSMSIEDCTQDVLLYIHRVLNGLDGRTANYDRHISKITTYLFVVVDSYFNNLIKTLLRTKRATILVPLEIIKVHPSQPEKATHLVSVREAREKVISMHLRATTDILYFIEENIYKPKRNRLTASFCPEDFKLVKNPYTKTMRKIKLTKHEVINKRIQSFRKLAKDCGVGINDYRLALSAELK